jgi:peptidoglycan biosynthesis protein MviN/MurJ (putative lipid II flippase)
MFLQAGAVSLALLLASRLLGLLRESALAAAYGASGGGDVAVLMLTLPDWIVGVLVTGALSYVLLPAWASADAVAVGAAQRRLARTLLAGGIVLAALLALARVPLAQWLAPGVGADLRGAAADALVWSAAAVPLALLAALGATRLQHEREFVGMYGANLVVNGVLIAALLLVAGSASRTVHTLGLGLLLAMALRLGWLAWRQRPFRKPAAAGADAAPPPLPGPSPWLWAALGAGLPLALPFLARTLASRAGEGALASFNYAWKLIELPQLLAIQLVATLALPAIARALAPPAPDAAAQDAAARAIRAAFALAWALACAAAAGLLLAAPAAAQLLFGWGRMDAEALERIAAWGRAGAWSLLPQALIAVALAVAAARRRMRPAVFAHAAALALLAAAGAFGVEDGTVLMLLLDAVLAGVAVWTLLALGADLRAWLPWRALCAALLVLGAWAVAEALAGLSGRLSLPVQFGLAVLAALSVLAATAASSADLRAALRR